MRALRAHVRHHAALGGVVPARGDADQTAQRRGGAVGGDHQACGEARAVVELQHARLALDTGGHHPRRAAQRHATVVGQSLPQGVLHQAVLDDEPEFGGNRRGCIEVQDGAVAGIPHVHVAVRRHARRGNGVPHAEAAQQGHRGFRQRDHTQVHLVLGAPGFGHARLDQGRAESGSGQAQGHGAADHAGTDHGHVERRPRLAAEPRGLAPAFRACAHGRTPRA